MCTSVPAYHTMCASVHTQLKKVNILYCIYSATLHKDTPESRTPFLKYYTCIPTTLGDPEIRGASLKKDTFFCPIEYQKVYCTMIACYYLLGHHSIHRRHQTVQPPLDDPHCLYPPTAVAPTTQHHRNQPSHGTNSTCM